MRRLFLVTVLALALCGCERPADEPGVAAVVNGRPIPLGRVEFQYDLRRLGAGETENPEVERLRADYGDILADLIVRELASQEVAKAGKSVGDAELAEAENQVRADYPPGAFEEMLVEESIDPQRWREGLRARLTAQKFFDEILRPTVAIDVQEAAEYYKENAAKFVTPAAVSCILVRGVDAARVRALLDRIASGLEVGSYYDDGQGANAQRISPRPENFPEAWAKAIKGLSPGQASKIMTDAQGAQALVFLENRPARRLDAAQAYPLVERALLEKKLEKAFAQWLTKTLATAKIRVSSRLLGESKESAAAGEAGPPGAPPEAALADRKASGLDESAPRALLAMKKAEERQEGTVSEEPSPPAGLDDAVADVPSGADSEEMPAIESPATPAPSAQAEVPAPASASDAPLAPDNAPQAVETSPVADAPAQTPAAQAAAGPSPPAAFPPAASETAPLATPTPVQTEAARPAAGPGEVEFLANKASWIILRVDGGKEEREYLKAGKKLLVKYKSGLAVRFGSPSDVTWRHGDRQETVVASPKEVKTADFP